MMVSLYGPDYVHVSSLVLLLQVLMNKCYDSYRSYTDTDCVCVRNWAASGLFVAAIDYSLHFGGEGSYHRASGLQAPMMANG